jgi:apolipoprotein N-acyltransferase
VGGVYAISFAVVFVNVLILSFLFLRKIDFFKQKAWWFSLGFFVFLLLVGKLYPVKSEPLKKPLSLALIQPNLQFPLKENSASVQRRLDHLLRDTQEVLSIGADLIVWPASLFVIKSEDQIWRFLRTLEKTSSEAHMLIGLTRPVTILEQEFYQSRVYLSDLNGNVRSIYIKQRLTPYTEYIPLGFLDFIGKRKMGSPEYISSKNADLVFNLGERRWATAICLEIFYPELLRRFIKGGAEFLIHLSNDDVYATSHFKKFLLRITALRALELGIPIFREAIDGYSASLNSHGQVEDVLFSGERGTIYAKLSEKVSPSLYATIGDIFSWLCIAIVILLSAGSLLRKSF